MKKLGTFYLMATIIVLLISCSKDLINTNDLSNGIENFSAETLTSVERSNNSFDAPVVIREKPDGPDGEFSEIPGASSKLHRTANGITVSFKTNGLIPGNAYTLWFVVFGDAPGPPSSTHAAGHIVGGSGKGNFSAHLSIGDIFDHPNVMTAFNNPLTAEVHMALRTHGPAQPGMVPLQLQTIDGGCTNGFPSGPVLYPDSDVVGYCANIQVGVHPKN